MQNIAIKNYTLEGDKSKSASLLIKFPSQDKIIPGRLLRPRSVNAE